MEKLIKVEITRSERELILNVPGLDQEVERKLKVTVMFGNAFMVKFPLEKVDAILESLEAEANRVEDAELQKAYHDLYNKLDRIKSAG
jgi:hypothetical protein